MYAAVLIAPKGNWVSDFYQSTIDEVWDRVYDMGSRWYFYPLVVVAETEVGRVDESSTIVDAGDLQLDYNDHPLRMLLTDARNGELDDWFQVNATMDPYTDAYCDFCGIHHPEI